MKKKTLKLVRESIAVLGSNINAAQGAEKNDVGSGTTETRITCGASCGCPSATC